ncbi:ABC transporter permease [Bradyrhizobium sp.]|uniref:ABC transporter permease n=1 Tax=Bradyrhizobium sp. TaxID=376 RepID=UPI002395A506|nr:ABC transporter permease subunit [Bradyrhizobium sp.]MDE1932583.1 ABC transporter permease subunit [Bradyrhizobium sp.]
MTDLSLDNAQKLAVRRRVRALDAIVFTLLMLALWQAIGSWTRGVAISPPLQTLVYLGGLLGTSMFWDDAAATLEAFLLAFVLSALIGLVLGLLLGIRRFAGEVAEPILAGFYTIPKVTLYPVVLLLFGLGMSAKVAFGVMHGLVPMTLFTLGAVRNLPPVLVRTARVLRLSPGRTMRWVLVPACLPDFVNGLRISFSLSLLGVLIGEMFSSQRGLGFLLVNGMAQNNVPLSTAVVTVIVMIAIAANALMLRVGRRFARRTDEQPDRQR